MKCFGSRLSQALELARLDAAEIARHCDIDVSTVNKWLHDEREISTVQAKNLYCVADFLSVCARWLATGEGEPRPNQAGISFTAMKLAERLDTLTPDQQLLVSALLGQLQKN